MKKSDLPKSKGSPPCVRLFDNQSDDPASRELKLELLMNHLDAMMATVSTGPLGSFAY